MKILAIETTGPNASVALTDESGEVREEISDKRLSHLQTLIPMVDILLKNCALGICQEKKEPWEVSQGFARIINM
jgi:tRNA threonylcarbamoyladenosine biosynthesis protein TsaB